MSCHVISLLKSIYRSVTSDVFIGFVNASIHAVNACLILVDAALISAIPVRLLHVWQPMFFVTSYFLFVVFYWAADGVDAVSGKRYVYEQLDFDSQPGIAACWMFGVTLLAIPASHAALYTIYRCRLAFFSAVFNN